MYEQAQIGILGGQNHKSMKLLSSKFVEYQRDWYHKYERLY